MLSLLTKRTKTRIRRKMLMRNEIGVRGDHDRVPVHD
jgi:hypothetical protein